MIGERTTELTQTNDRLRAEISERQKSESPRSCAPSLRSTTFNNWHRSDKSGKVKARILPIAVDAGF
jgi:hypothetical protein